MFVHGPPSNWQEIQDSDQLQRISLTQPCTTSKGTVWLDGLMGGIFASNGYVFLRYGDDFGDSVGTITYGVGFLGIAAPFLAGAVAGNRKANECRAFIARVLELRRGSASSLTSHEWLDELFPLPDLGVTGLDPVFGIPIN